MTTAPVADEEFATERWTYIGKRRSGKNSLVFAFIDPTGAELWYTTVRTTNVIGGVYDVRVHRAGEGDNQRIVMRRNPDWTGEYAPGDDELSAEARRTMWALEDRRAKQDVERIRTERKTGERDELRLAMEPLREIAGRCRTRAQREALLVVVIAELGTVR